MVRRRHTHVGAPDNRIKALFKKHVLTPRGKDMNPVLGPVVPASPGSKLSYLKAGSNGNIKLVIPRLRSGQGEGRERVFVDNPIMFDNIEQKRMS
jgi:hypothetical protein